LQHNFEVILTSAWRFDLLDRKVMVHASEATSASPV